MTVPDLSKINLADWLAAGSLRNQGGEADRMLLQHCATVRTFDRALYDQELSRGLDGAMSFEALAAHPAIQRLPGDVERYQMRGSFRAEIFEGWWSDGSARAGEAPPALKEFSCRLVDYYSALAQTPAQPDSPGQAPPQAAARQGLEIERMVHLVACDPDQAGRLFSDLFAAAEQRFDLPRCLELIRALEERRTILGPALATRLTTARRRLNTRSMWAQEYYQTAFYLERQATKSLLDELLAGQAPPPAGPHWILQLYAPGGMGKSMYLRAVIARHCVEREIPCARLDFDYLDHLAALMREPWRLLLQMAYQLDIQLTGQPFQGYLLDNAAFIPLGGYRPTPGAQPFVTLSAAEAERKAEQVVGDFCRIAASLFQERPVVLIFDTVEQLRHLPPLPNQPDSLGAFFDMLQTLHTRLPGVRVLLAGRFDLRTPADGVASSYTTHFQGQERTVELGGFSRTESMTYLQEQRRMHGDPRLEMVVEKAKGNPFKLALLADVLRDVPEITVDELAAYPDADLIYLIERIILRIDKRLRWLLRYGVVPRLLTRDFVLEVMAPYLIAAMQGESEDNPSEDDLPPRVLDKQPFPVEPEAAQLDIAGLWDSLIRYASRSSWVSTVSERPDAVVFHPEVLEPMRNLIRTQPVYEKLHGAAAAYFRKRAEQAPEQRAEWLAHAVYHTYLQADAYALSLLRGPDAAVAEATAMLLLTPRSVDEPFTADAGVMAQANYVMAYRRLQSPDTPDLTEVARWLNQAESYNQTRPVLRPAQLAYGRAALALRQGRPEEAAALAREAIPFSVDKANLFDLRFTYAQALAALNDPQALDAYRAAWEMAWTLGMMQMASEFVAALEAGEALEEALQRVEGWQSHAQSDAAALGRSLLAQVQVNLTLGREAAAVEVAQRGQDPARWSSVAPAVAGYWQGRLRIEAELARQQPDLAWGIFDAWAGDVNERQFQAGPFPDLPGGWAQEEGELRARIALARFDLHTADAEWERLAAHEGLPPAHRAAYALRRIWPHLALAPDPEQAAFRLEQARTLPLTLQQQVELARLAAWQTALTGDSESARRQSDELRSRPDLATLPHRLQVAVALETAVHHPGDDAAIAGLVDALAQAEPASYRLRLLDELWRCPPLSTPSPALVDRWLALLPGPDEPGLDPALAVLRLAEVYRVVGRRDEALRLLDLARLATRAPLRLALRYRLYQAYDRLGWEPSLLAETQLEEQDDPSWRANPTLAGLMALDHAERVLSVLNERAWAAKLWQTANGLLSATLPAWRRRLDRLELALQAPQAHERRVEEAAPEAEEGSEVIVEDDYVTIGGVRLRRREPIRQEAVEAGRPQLRLTLTQPGEMQWHLEARLPDGATLMHSIALGTDLPDFTSGRGEVVHRGFVQALLEDPQGLADHFSARLLTPEIAALLATPETAPESAPDIIWHAPSRDLAWLPWELLLRLPEPPGGRPLSLAGRAFYRPATPPATPFQATAPDHGVDVLIVEPISGGEAYLPMAQRNVGDSAGVDLKRIYEVAGARIMPLSDADERVLGDMLEKLQPRVVHLVAEVREQGRRVALDIGSQRLVKSAGPAGLAATGLAGALERCATPPLVILQIPSVPTDYEQVRQLCLRNAFAQAVIELAPRISLFGMGLGDGQSQLEQAELLVAGFTEGQPLEALARRIWEAGAQAQTLDTPRLDRLLAFLGAALFTHDPTQQFGWANR